MHLAEAGIHTFLLALESFTPDDRYYLAKPPEGDGLLGWRRATTPYRDVSSGGAVMALAQWNERWAEPPLSIMGSRYPAVRSIPKRTAASARARDRTLGLILNARSLSLFGNGERRGALPFAVARASKRRAVLSFGESPAGSAANWFANERHDSEYELYLGPTGTGSRIPRAEHMRFARNRGGYSTDLVRERSGSRGAMALILLTADVRQPVGRVHWQDRLYARCS